MRLTKFQGLGNDFLVALAADNPGLAPEPDRARAVCDRRRGIGADGLILGLPAAGPGRDAEMVLLNSDGSPAEISGNGIRCLAQALLREGTVEGPEVRVGTPAGTRLLTVVGGDPRDELWIDVDMGPAAEGPEPTAAARAFGASRLATVDVGNPHLVLLVDDPDEVDLAVDGPALEAGFPGGINVHFVRADAPDRLVLRVWERGSGVTEACGSGATAAVVAATDWGVVEGRVEVEMAGGTAAVEVVDGHAHLIGPSRFVGEVVVP
jgi:diaminopimelate epimerase